MSDEQTPVEPKPWGWPPPPRVQDFIVPVLLLNGLGAIISLAGVSTDGGDDSFFVWVTVLIPAPFAVANLLAIWAAFGGGPNPWRLLLVLVPTALLASGILIRGLTDTPPGMWVLGLLLQTAVTSPVLLALRLGGARIARPDSPSEHGPRRFQFSLRLLLEWTCAVAVLSATLSLFSLEALGELARFGNWLFYFLLLFAFNTFLAVAVLALTFTPKQSVMWLFCLATAVVLGMAGLAAGGAAEGILAAAIVWSCQIAWMIGTLWPFRRAGFRLTWSGRFSEGASPGTGGAQDRGVES